MDPENGRNNALRINGLGAPRAFDTAIARAIGFPNVSYGEDYAVALRICREYEIGRIYDSVYLCRRWEGNTDSALPLETANRYDSYKDGYAPMKSALVSDVDRSARVAGRGLACAGARPAGPAREPDARRARLSGATFSSGTFLIESRARRPPSTRFRSHSGHVFCAPATSIRRRRGFRSIRNSPSIAIRFPSWTAISRSSTAIIGHSVSPASSAPSATGRGAAGSFLIYNGPECGASAPDHLHFQACSREIFPIEHDTSMSDGYIPRVFILRGRDPASLSQRLETLMDVAVATVTECGFRTDDQHCSLFLDGESWTVLVFPRGKHRPGSMKRGN